MTTFEPGANPIVYATYIATVWFSDSEDQVGPRRIIQLPAVSAEDFQTQLRQAWPSKILSFGPVGLAKGQG